MSNNARSALKEMAWTSKNSASIKQMHGGSLAGRKSNGVDVFHFSLSWHPSQTPSRAEMEAAGVSALRAQGLEDHEAVFIAHNDEQYKHLHIVANLVDHYTGRKHAPRMPKRNLSAWAEQYEKDTGQVFCKERVKNNARRRNGEKVYYKEKPHDRKAEIKAMYEQSKDRAEFTAKTRAAGLEIGQHRKRIIIVDREGKNYNLARNVDGKTKAIREKFGDMDDLPDVKAIREAQATQEKERTDRAAEGIEATTGRQNAPEQGKEDRGELLAKEKTDSAKTRRSDPRREVERNKGGSLTKRPRQTPHQSKTTNDLAIFRKRHRS